jgi:predicted nucleotidyltransferase
MIQNILLQGVVGSTAYGLATEDSDVDRLGIFAAPTEDFHGLHMPVESYVQTDPDVTMHEAGKYCRLALAGNPTVMELMWLKSYEVETFRGHELIRLRQAFLSAKRVRDAYLGYATQQFKKLEDRADGSFSADLRKRTEKHARHLLRLCTQGLNLYTTGELMIHLEDPEPFMAFGQRVAAGDIDFARRTMARFEHAFDTQVTMLPERPDEKLVESWLRNVRYVLAKR